jgi:thymidine phosphorylase
VIIHSKVGDRVAAGQPLFTIYANDAQRMAEARASLLQAHRWSESQVPPLPLFYGLVR